MPFSSPLDSFLKNIHQCREKAPKELTGKINDIARKAVEEMSEEAGKFLHENLDDDKHTPDQLKTVIALFPKSLSMLNDNGHLPIQSAASHSRFNSARRSSITFVPLLAKEGYRLDVGGEENRGGLLSAMPNEVDFNTISFIVTSWFRGLSKDQADDYDSKRAQVLEELLGLNLLKKVDIEDSALVIRSLNPFCVRRFNFIVSWNPESLGIRVSICAEPINFALSDMIDTNKGKEERFEMALKAGMTHYPERLGFLFRKDEGNTACKTAFDKIGVDKTMAIIKRCIPPSDNHPILHHALEQAPDLVDAICNYYPDAIFPRDANGHKASQVEFYTQLRRGGKMFKDQARFFANATDEQVNTIDPKTGLYPFMLAAVARKSDLPAVYYLLCRNPELISVKHYEKTSTTNSDCRQSNRKRQRDEQSS